MALCDEDFLCKKLLNYEKESNFVFAMHIYSTRRHTHECVYKGVCERVSED